jgi:hypothetical protein
MSMKKILVVSLVFILVSLMSLQVLAAEHWNSNVTVYGAEGAVNIDGKIDAGEWDDATAIPTTLVDDPLEKSGYVIYQGGWEADRVATDFSAEYKVKWDKDYLYFLEVRKDDVVNLNGNGVEPYFTDGVLVFLQIADDDNPINPDGYSHHIFYSVGNEGAVGGSVMVRICDEAANGRETVEAKGAKISTALTGDGYIAEIAFPWSVFQEKVTDYKGPAAGDNIGFSLVVHDNDDKDSTGFVKQFCWAYMPDNIPAGGYDFGGWGVLQLNAAPVVVTEAPVTEAPATDAAPVDTTPAAQTADITGIVVLAAVAAFIGVAVVSKKRV